MLRIVVFNGEISSLVTFRGAHSNVVRNCFTHTNRYVCFHFVITNI
uniref:Uncharacterized protein n=1 Tax=Anguilla anguilla TaxID=7936 RepID=A0A0E9R0K9_ANGAN